MSTDRVLQFARRGSESAFLQAHRRHQARQFGTCSICLKPIADHFTGPHCSGRMLGCDVAGERGADQLVAHAGQSRPYAGDRQRTTGAPHATCGEAR